MNILLHLWPGDLATQIKNLNNAIEVNLKKAVGYPSITKLVSKNEWIVWLGCFTLKLVLWTYSLYNKINMVGSIDLSKHMKTQQQ